MKKHILVNTKRKNFQCVVCETKFRNDTLQTHVSIHTKIKDHECDIWKKKFSLKGNLVQQPHECDICYKTFTHKGNWVIYFRIHLLEKLYGCSKCETWFIESGNRDNSP